MAVKLQPEYSGNPGNNKYKGIMAKQLASFIPCFTLSGILLPFSGNILQKSVNYFEGCMRDAGMTCCFLSDGVTNPVQLKSFSCKLHTLNSSHKI